MLNIVKGKMDDPHHAVALVQLLDLYAHDPAGGGKGLSDYARAHLPEAIRGRDHVHVVLAFEEKEPAGLIVCIEGFSTFACRPLMNIHDVVVAPRFRGQGIATRMLEAVEALARERGCCKLTLEVLEGNHPARAAYRKFGFNGYQLDPEMGQAQFWEKPLHG
ncbi:MAG TPA: GNAT family N-acetyltransferase [Sedimenticola sp.]|nr:GNAT family N-acetyltransferase [Sedimenticola sp.]